VLMHVADLRQTVAGDSDSARNIVFLEDADGSRRLPIWIGRPVATALAISLEDVELPRPWTHQFAASLLHAAGGEVREVRIVALTDFTFYAQVVLGDGTAVDSRPSDALTLAVHLGAPIRVARNVLDQADARSVHEDDRLDLEAAHERGRDTKEIVQDVTSRLARDAERYAARADRPT
jgi:bifunctional DNase/RNase